MDDNSFPEIYDGDTLRGMYDALDMTDEDISLLRDYFDAFANFYMVLSLKDAYKIIKRQNKDLITREKFTKFADMARHENHSYYILGDDELYEDEAAPDNPLDRKIVECSLVEIDYELYYDLAESIESFELFIPAKELLLKYKSDSFYEKNVYSEALYNFFVNKLRMNEEEANQAVLDCFPLLRVPSDSPYLCVDYFKEEEGYKFTRNNLEEFLDIIERFYQNMRNPYFRGLTYKEWACLKRDNYDDE